MLSGHSILQISIAQIACLIVYNSDGWLMLW